MPAILVPAARFVVGAGFLVVAAVLALAPGCEKASLEVEEYVEGQWRSIPGELTQARVQRDGRKLIAHFVIECRGDQRLILESRLEVDPQVSFLAGKWTHVQGNGIAGQGAMRASSVDFLGGQGGKPSIGGRFTLRDNDGTDRYRAAIPATPAEVVTWP